MHLLRYRDSSTGVIGVGVLRRDTISTIPGVTSLAQLWRLSREDLQAAVTGATGEQCTLADVTVAAPVDGRTEVWACGVTYEISREARTEESERWPGPPWEKVRRSTSCCRTAPRSKTSTSTGPARRATDSPACSGWPSNTSSAPADPSARTAVSGATTAERDQGKRSRAWPRS